MDLKLLAQANKWMAMSIPKVGNPGTRSCNICGKMGLILVY